ncbi:unnamed protein product [marine sediment metagenome]|uniref:Uncharacterized protein n=1 Tax=marine sediment metagenome TaxID=412755 RepID=X1FLH4_9ZZZZ
MTTVYPKEVLDKFIIREGSSFNKEQIDREVKELRAQGFQVRRKKYGNIEGSGEIYSYEARKER